MPTAWRNKETGLWLVQYESRTHTKTNTIYSETDNLQHASIVMIPDYQIRISKKYESVEVVVVRTVTVKDEEKDICWFCEGRGNYITADGKTTEPCPCC